VKLRDISNRTGVVL